MNKFASKTLKKIEITFSPTQYIFSVEIRRTVFEKSDIFYFLFPLDNCYKNAISMSILRGMLGDINIYLWYQLGLYIWGDNQLLHAYSPKPFKKVTNFTKLWLRKKIR